MKNIYKFIASHNSFLTCDEKQGTKLIINMAGTINSVTTVLNYYLVNHEMELL